MRLLLLLGTTTIHALMAPPRQLLRRPYQIQPAQMTPELQTALTLNTGLAVAGTLAGQKQLTKTGLVHAWALGVILWSSFVGWRGYSLCVLYLVVGSAATKIKQKQKEAQGIAEGRGGARGPENVWGSAATAALCALYGFRKPYKAHNAAVAADPQTFSGPRAPPRPSAMPCASFCCCFIFVAALPTTKYSTHKE